MVRKKKNKFKFDIKYVALIITFFFAVVFCFTVYSVKTNRKLNVFEKTIKDSALFVGNVVTTPFEFCKNKITDLSELINIKKKYDKIKKEKDEIEFYKNENETLKKEINELKKMLDLKDIKSLYKIKNATVLTRNNNSWFDTLNINVGSQNGIKDNMAVLNNNVLIGYTTSTSYYSSSVLLLSSEKIQNKISVVVSSKDNDIHGLLIGYDYNKKVYIIEGISDNANIKKGDKVITSGLNDLFPRGLLIGNVSKIRKDEYDLTRIIEVKPAIDFDNINYVSVLIGDEK